VDTLHVVACNSPADVMTVDVICDAQRGDLFVGKYCRDKSGQWVPQQSVRQVSPPVWANELIPTDVVSGPGLEKFHHVIEGRCRVLNGDLRRPQAEWVARLATDAQPSGQATDLWCIEPLYLRRSSAETQWEKLHPP
jgi:tRNA threonylcarbamoyladenosine biosynthesis protein TsaB